MGGMEVSCQGGQDGTIDGVSLPCAEQSQHTAEPMDESVRVCVCVWCVCAHMAETGKEQDTGMVREAGPRVASPPSLFFKNFKVSIWRPGTGQSHFPVPFCPEEEVGSSFPSPPWNTTGLTEWPETSVSMEAA